MEAALKRKDREAEGKAAVGGESTILGFRPAWFDFEERILIAPVGRR